MSTPRCDSLPPRISRDIRKERRRLLNVPDEYRARIPPGNLAVTSLLDFDLPALGDITTGPVKETLLSFSDHCPDDLPPDFSRRTIPPRAFSKSLLDSLTLAIVDGKQSILDSRYPGESAWLPLWVLAYWDRISVACEAKSSWAAARSWLSDCAADDASPDGKASAAVDDVMEVLGHLAWDVPLHGCGEGMNSSNLADFLRPRKVKGRFVDAIFSDMARRVRDSFRNNISVQDLTFQQTLRSLDSASRDDYYSSTSFTALRRLGESLKAGTCEVVVVPINHSKVHWALFVIDARTRAIRYGDTLDWEHPAIDVKRILRWLEYHDISESFRFLADSPLEHGLQDDSYSCAIGMANIAKRYLFGEPLFTPERS